MILIGEKLNSSIPKTLEAFKERNVDYVTDLINKQAINSKYIDVNTAMCDDEIEVMRWVIELVESNCDCGIMIDTTNPETMAEAVKFVKTKDIILNSLTLTQRFDEVSKIALENNCKVVALPIDDIEVPENSTDRINNSLNIIKKLNDIGIKNEDIYVDVLAETLAVNDTSAKTVLETIEGIRKTNSDVHITCGLSNISFGLPERQKINQAMLIACMTRGLDSAICDTANEDFVKTAYAGDLIIGNDEYCMEYITKVKNS